MLSVINAWNNCVFMLSLTLHLLQSMRVIMRAMGRKVRKTSNDTTVAQRNSRRLMVVVLPGVGNGRACPDSAETDPSLRPPDKNHIMDEGDV